MTRQLSSIALEQILKAINMCTFHDNMSGTTMRWMRDPSFDYGTLTNLFETPNSVSTLPRGQYLGVEENRIARYLPSLEPGFHPRFQPLDEDLSYC